MSSNTPQHMDSIARPTSKVLAPPGGVSSNIFGTDPEPIKGIFLQNVKDFNIFPEFDPKNPRHQTNDIFGTRNEREAQEAENRKNEKALTEQTKQKPTTVKVHAPPGGHSSIIFG